MGDEISDTMNLDLNLGPVSEAGSGSISAEAVNLDAWEAGSRSISADAVNLDEWIDNPFDRIREAVRRRRWRYQQVRIPALTQNISVELDEIPAVAQSMSLTLDHLPSVAHNISAEFDRSLASLGSISTLQAGEGSVAAGDRINDAPKMCENNNGFLEDNVSQKNDVVEKGSGCDGSFFDCNVCLDLAKDPVVTCCGHLFCWSCIYQWLHVHSDAKECPVCKGEVTIKTVTPIYGRGNVSRALEDDSGLKIPPRPNAKRVESLRQTIQRTAFGLPVEEMIRQIGSRFELTRDSTPPGDTNGTRDTTERTNTFINRVLTSQMRAVQNPAVPVEEVDLTQNSTVGHEVAYHRSMLFQRQAHLRRAARISSLSSALSSAERLVEAYFRSNPAGRNQDQAPPVDDRDSFSSIVAVINPESQMDTAAEIDSVVSLSTTSTSRRRSDSSRVSDVDSGDSRAPRRRRLN